MISKGPFTLRVGLFALLFGLPLRLMAQNTPCEFNVRSLQFAGNAVAQAKCLLRPNRKGGVLGSPLDKLPSPFDKILGTRLKVKPQVFRTLLRAAKISEADIGGAIELPLATAKLPDGKTVSTLYFVIHDTSSPYLKDLPFPADFDTDVKWKGNDLTIWLNQPVAHVFVNRVGESATTTPFGKPVEKGWGTKFARDFLGADAKGLQLHIELVQPRRRDTADRNPANDLIAPEPGFTDPQYERLAILYVAASLRRGSWLIPAYHSAIDAGIKGAHDDPQNFDLERFGDHLGKLLNKVK